MAALKDLLKYLNENRINYQVINHLPVFRAHQLAQVTHVPDIQLAKTLIVKADSTYWMAVLPANARIDEKELKYVLQAQHVYLAHEGDLDKLFPGCELGAMPPFGNLYGLPVILDTSLAVDNFIVFNACTHTESVRMRFNDYVRLVNPTIAEFTLSHTLSEER
jgi:Ala-tRNA(Pro) deacylase